MSTQTETLSKERIQLQNEYREHIAKNGFDYMQYLNPPAGSFYEKYKTRLAEIDAVLAPELKYHH